MATSALRCTALVVLLCLAVSRADGGCGGLTYEMLPSGKPLLKRPAEHSYKTVLSLGAGGLRGVVMTMVMIEVEHAVKQYLLDHQECIPDHLEIGSMDDFDINLADYFDCVTAVSSGAWQAAYLASRGGQGASRSVLDDPAILEKYGPIPTGGAEGLRVLFNEYGSIIYPLETIDPNAGIPFDPTNPMAPGSTEPLFGLEGVEQAMEAFLGNSTLADADTTLLIPTVDLGTGLTIYFVQNTFKVPSVTSTATLVTQMGPQEPPVDGMSLLPDIEFAHGKNYFLKDVSAAASAAIVVNPAKPIKQVGNDTIEYFLADGATSKEIPDFFGALFVSNENQLFNFQKVAVLSLGLGTPQGNFTDLRNAGNTQWAQGVNYLRFLVSSGASLWTSLMDYLYYADPSTKPFQYLRINGLAPNSSDVPTDFELDVRSVPRFEEFGQRVAAEHREQIDIFVRDFIFG